MTPQYSKQYAAKGMEKNNKKRQQEEVSINIEGTGLLDPHLSILHYLEGESSTADLQTTNKISESWHNVNKKELIEDTMQHKMDPNHGRPSSALSTMNNNGVGILSSSDTSSEEDLPQEPSPNVTFSPESLSNVLTSTQSHDPVSFYSASLPTALNNLDTHIQHESDTNTTITKSLSSSSNSFIMPKLSLSSSFTNPTGKDKTRQVLILGRHGLKFFKSIPSSYQPYFQLPTSHNPKDYEPFSCLLIIVKELRELITLLNRVSKSPSSSSQPPSLVILYQREQRVQAKNIMNSFLRKKLISLYYPLVDIDNNEELDKLFAYIRDCLNRTSDVMSTPTDDTAEIGNHLDYSPSSSSTSSVGSHRNKSPNKSKKKRSKRDKDKGKTKKWLHYILNKWVIMGISFSVGIGATYFISINLDEPDNNHNTTMLNKHFPLVRSFKQLPVIQGILNIFRTGTSITNGNMTTPTPSVSDGNYVSKSFSHCMSFIKGTLSKLNTVIKNTLSSTTNSLFPFDALSKINDWNVDDPCNFITLSYVTV